MPIPSMGMPFFSVGLNKIYETSANNVDPWLEMGSPAMALVVNIFVPAGTVIGSASPASPAMLLRFYDGSDIRVFVAGKIGAAGGVGGGGDRGRNNGTASSFVGGGGGGGAGVVLGPGGAKATGGTTATDGSAGTATTGGLGGANEFGTPSNGGYTAGSVVNRLARNPAILAWPADGHSITVRIWNSGSIFAGGDGGLGGFQDGALPGGANAPANGEDLPSYYDPAPGALTDHPAIGYRSGKVTMSLLAGASHPAIKGRLIAFTGLP